MLLEKVKFLEKAIRIAKEEAFEEIEAIREGKDVGNGLLVLESILKDLLDTAENFESFQTEEEEELLIAIPTFEIGEKVVKTDTGTFLATSIILSKFHSFPGDKRLYRKFEKGDHVTVIGKAPYPYSEVESTIYLVEKDGMISVVSEYGIAPLKEDEDMFCSFSPEDEFEFEIGESVFAKHVYIKGGDEEAFDDLFDDFGVSHADREFFDSEQFLDDEKKDKGIIIDRALELGNEEQPLYIWEYKGNRYFVEEENLLREKDDDEDEYEFAIGDRVITECCYIPDDKLFEHFDVVDRQKELFSDDDRRIDEDNPAIIIDRTLNYEDEGEEHIVYIAKHDGQFFFVEECDLEIV